MLIGSLIVSTNKGIAGDMYSWCLQKAFFCSPPRFLLVISLKRWSWRSFGTKTLVGVSQFNHWMSTTNGWLLTNTPSRIVLSFLLQVKSFAWNQFNDVSWQYCAPWWHQDVRSKSSCYPMPMKRREETMGERERGPLILEIERYSIHWHHSSLHQSPWSSSIFFLNRSSESMTPFLQSALLGCSGVSHWATA